MRKMFAGLVIALMMVLPALAQQATEGASAAAGAVAAREAAAPPLVSVAWLRERLGRPGIRIVDVGDPRVYRQAHIPGAIFTDYGHWRVERGGVRAMLPDEKRLAKLMGSLGIRKEDHVVLVPIGYSVGDIGAATRIFWTMKIAGHEKVSILDGGLRAWTADKRNPLESKVNTPTPTTYEVRLDTRWLATAADVRKALNLGEPQLVDNRRPGEFMGVIATGSVARPGTLPGARNVPQQWLVDMRTGRFRSLEQLRRIHEAMGVGNGKVIHFCNTGHRASLGWFVRAMLLNMDSTMYDGSLAEWTRLKPEKEYPLEVKIDLSAPATR